MDGRIVKTAQYGQHILLTCKNHPALRWNTKNIGSIGIRTIFFRGNENKEIDSTECDCSIKDLVVAKEQLAMAEVEK